MTSATTDRRLRSDKKRFLVRMAFDLVSAFATVFVGAFFAATAGAALKGESLPWGLLDAGPGGMNILVAATFLLGFMMMANGLRYADRSTRFRAVHSTLTHDDQVVEVMFYSPTVRHQLLTGAAIIVAFWATVFNATRLVHVDTGSATAVAFFAFVVVLATSAVRSFGQTVSAKAASRA